MFLIRGLVSARTWLAFIHHVVGLIVAIASFAIVVDAIDIANYPVTLGNLGFHFAGDAVIKIQMLPTVALRCPNNLLAVIQVVTVPSAGGESRT